MATGMLITTSSRAAFTKVSLQNVDGDVLATATSTLLVSERRAQ